MVEKAWGLKPIPNVVAIALGVLLFILIIKASAQAVQPQVVAGAGHTVGLRSDGKVVAVGRNIYGQLNVCSWTDIVQVAAGAEHTVGLRSDGKVVAVGWNNHGQCNVGAWTDIVQVAAGGWYTVGLKSDGKVVAVGKNFFGQLNVGSWMDIVQIATGYEHTLGLKSDGEVVAVGRNDYGECNVGSWTDIVQIAGGDHHTLGLESNGEVVAAGVNSYGQCNVGAWTDILQVAGGHIHTVGLKPDGKVLAVGGNFQGQCDVGAWADIVQLASLWNHTVGLKSDGQVMAAGSDDNGQCDVSDWNLMPEPSTHCVSSVQELHNALAEAENNTMDDIVQIVQGTYTGTFVYESSENYSLIMKGGYTEDCDGRVVDPANTVLDGQDIARVLELNTSGVSADFVVDGLSLQNGNMTGNSGGGIFILTDNGSVRLSNSIVDRNSSSPPSDWTGRSGGGGIYVRYADTVTLEENRITNNETHGYGGGVYVADVNVVDLKDNIITGNRGSHRGGGMFIGWANSAIVTNNTISDNETPHSPGSGGGVHISSHMLTFTNNSISGNNAEQGGGGLFDLYPSTRATFANNLFVNNTAPRGGGGIYLVWGDIVDLESNIVSNNSASRGGGVYVFSANRIILTNNIINNNVASENGGGISYFRHPDHPYSHNVTLTNNTIVHNSAGSGGGIWIELYGGEDIAEIYNSIIWGNTAVTGADLSIDNDPDGDSNSNGSVNLFNNDYNPSSSGLFIAVEDGSVVYSDNLDNVDPQFVDPANDDYHLGPGSPCIDAGVDPIDPALPLEDFEGDDRVVGPAPDIGADEFVVSDSDGDGIPDDEDACPFSDLSDTVVIDGWDSGVENVLLEDGCTVSDLVSQCAEGADNHGEFVSSVSHTTNSLMKNGIINGNEKAMIQKGAARADLP